ncbi:MAG: hypothetical protein ACE5HD_01170, partial [Acidobacteriota bacterium]
WHGVGDHRQTSTLRGTSPTEVNTIVVLYGYQSGEARDRNHWQYLVAFDPINGVTYQPTRWILVGGGPQRFERITIKNQVITLSGAKRLPGDAMCCPSGQTTVQFIFLNGQLVTRGS